MSRKQNRKRRSENNPFWQSYSDMMTSMLLIMILVLVGTVLQAQKNFEEKEKAIQDWGDEIAQKETEISIKESEIAWQESEIAWQESQIAEIQGSLDDMNARFEEILGVRKEIIQALTDAFQDEAKLSVNEEGSIMFDSELLFDTDESELKESGKAFLADFIPDYMNVLMHHDFSEYISEIIVEGHADLTGSYLYNLELSQERALSVVSYLLSDESELFTEEETANLRRIMTANGRSWSKPVYFPDGTVDMDSSRRVEIQFRLKDDDMIREMTEILQEN